MRRYGAIAVFALALALSPASAFAAGTSAAGAVPVETDGPEIISMTSGLDGATIAFEGEVVSEALAGGDGHVWVNVLSDGTAIGIWMPVEMTDDLEVFGDWGNTGDVVRVVGILNEGCDQHGGDLDVHAASLELVKRGSERENPYDLWKLGVGLAGLVLAGVGYRRMRRSEEGDLL